MIQVLQEHVIEPTKKHVAKPNSDEYNAKIAAERESIQKLLKRMAEISSKVSELRAGNSDYQKQRELLRTELDAVTKKVETLEAARAKILAVMDESQKSGRDVRSKMQSLKKNVGFQSVEEIDAKIKALENHLMTKRLPIPEENRIIAQIKQLKMSKPSLDKPVDLEPDASTQSQGLLKHQFEEIKKELRLQQQKKRDLTDRVRSLVQKNSKNTSPARALAEDRDQIKKDLDAHRQEERRLKIEFNTQLQAYQAHISKIEKTNFQKKRDERRKREIKNMRDQIQWELDQLDEAPCNVEYKLTQQTLDYLKKILDQVNNKNDQTKLLETSIPDDNSLKENEQLKSYKKEDQDDFYFAPTKKKGGKKQRKQATSLKFPIIHSIATLADFTKLSIDPPFNLDECSACIEQLEKNLQILKVTQQEEMKTAESKKEELIDRLNKLEI